jgi:hypothetical protein
MPSPNKNLKLALFLASEKYDAQCEAARKKFIEAERDIDGQIAAEKRVLLKQYEDAKDRASNLIARNERDKALSAAKEEYAQKLEALTTRRKKMLEAPTQRHMAERAAAERERDQAYAAAKAEHR